MSAIIPNVDATDDAGELVIKSLRLHDRRFDTVSKGSRRYEVIITDGTIDPNSDRGRAELEGLLDRLDPDWRDHVTLP
jgi:hypothetical protein